MVITEGLEGVLGGKDCTKRPSSALPPGSCGWDGTRRRSPARPMFVQPSRSARQVIRRGIPPACGLRPVGFYVTSG
jgi:hypothetical protein